MDGRVELTRSILAIASDTRVAVALPPGTIVEIVGGPLDGNRLSDVLCDGKPMMMFVEDLKHGAREWKG